MSAIAADAAALRWMYKRDMMNIIVDHGGTIFGGAVRDLVRHERHAIRFYEAFQAAHGRKATREEYANAVNFPEYDGRFAIPDDIDVMIHTKDLNDLLNAISRSAAEYKMLFTRDAKQYLPNIEVERGEVLHKRLRVWPMMRNMVGALEIELRKLIPSSVRNMMTKSRREISETLQTLVNEMIGFAPNEPFTIDLLIVGLNPTSLEPLPEAPFGGLDFECNGLLMDREGVRMSRWLRRHCCAQMHGSMFFVNKKLEEVFHDIEHARARWCGTHNQGYRIRRMVNKGWNVQGFHLIERRSEAYEGWCIICHDGFADADHWKIKCCDARYHEKCLRKYLREIVVNQRLSNQCCMCKVYCHESTLASDLALLENLIPEATPA